MEFSEEFLHFLKISDGSISCNLFCFFEGEIESRLSEIELPLGRSNAMISSEFFRLLEDFILELSSLGSTSCKWLLVPKIYELHVYIFLQYDLLYLLLQKDSNDKAYVDFNCLPDAFFKRQLVLDKFTMVYGPNQRSSFLDSFLVFFLCKTMLPVLKHGPSIPFSFYTVPFAPFGTLLFVHQQFEG